MTDPVELTTPRLRLRTWTDADRDDLARMMADPDVMHHYGGPINKVESDRKLDDYADGFTRHGYSRWLIESTEGPEPEFIGYAGVAAHTTLSIRLARTAILAGVSPGRRGVTDTQPKQQPQHWATCSPESGWPKSSPTPQLRTLDLRPS